MAGGDVEDLVFAARRLGDRHQPLIEHGSDYDAHRGSLDRSIAWRVKSRLIRAKSPQVPAVLRGRLRAGRLRGVNDRAQQAAPLHLWAHAVRPYSRPLSPAVLRDFALKRRE